MVAVAQASWIQEEQDLKRWCGRGCWQYVGYTLKNIEVVSMYTQLLGAGRDCGDTAALELPDDLKKVWVNVWCLDPWIFQSIIANFQQTWGWTFGCSPVHLSPPRVPIILFPVLRKPPLDKTLLEPLVLSQWKQVWSL